MQLFVKSFIQLALATILALVSLNTVSASGGKNVLNRDYMTTYKVKDQYDFVVDAVKEAIGDRGIKINGVNHIGKMLHRTAGAVGASKKMFTKAKAYNFCSSTLSRATMEADPHNVAFCPYIITVYELVKEPGIVYITYRKPLVVGNAASKKALKAIGDLLDGIVKDATGQ